MNAQTGSVVVLVHGFACHKLMMTPLAQVFRRHGHAVFNWGYSSLTADISVLSAKLAEEIEQRFTGLQVHGVGHSLGGIILRQTFQIRGVKESRLVTMGSPHHGARILDRNPRLFLNRYMPAALHQLSPKNTYMRSLPKPTFSIGCIIGLQRMSIYSPVSWIGRATLGTTSHDGVVEHSSARLDAETPQIQVGVGHGLLPFSPTVARQALHFIKRGEFLAEG